MRLTSPTLLAFGGLAGLVASSRSPSTAGRWRDLAPIPKAPRQEHTTVALSPTTLAVLGGIVTGSEPAVTTNIMQLYDIPTNTWSSAPNIPVPMNHINAAVVDGKIYLLGGLAVLSNGSWSAIPDSWVFDPEEAQWKSIAPMPKEVARGSAAMGVHGKTIYLAGGMTILVPGVYQNSVDTVSAFDTTKGTWKTLSKQLPEGRDHAGAAVVDSAFYVLGGRNFGQNNVRDTVFSLNLKNHSGGWKDGSARLPTARGGLSIGTIGISIYAFGGEGNRAEGTNGVFNQTELLLLVVASTFQGEALLKVLIQYTTQMYFALREDMLLQAPLSLRMNKLKNSMTTHHLMVRVCKSQSAFELDVRRASHMQAANGKV
ncbi:kelch motif domain-containing protein [Hirsutella rhossiliensis]|uniref:Kelch motif domain-containing protein n=1 Tax=Hirsutella rhossiliensis TaxID=111463 RepID=A0A9P8MV96_9HYPO|nr:kelch motif domain-containing protein [Hirsutella rhossiliensis]KAH0962828.1 kelch motif domain-containing protein [Hirsutella rhossiliensis]